MSSNWMAVALPSTLTNNNSSLLATVPGGNGGTNGGGVGGGAGGNEGDRSEEVARQPGRRPLRPAESLTPNAQKGRRSVSQVRDTM